MGFSTKQTSSRDSVTSTNHRCLLSFPLVSQQGESQRRLYRELLRNYNRLERPVVNDSQPLVVELQLSLLQIIDVVSYLLFCFLRHSYGITNLIPCVGTVLLLLIRLSDCLRVSSLPKCWSTCFDTLEE